MSEPQYYPNHELFLDAVNFTTFDNPGLVPNSWKEGRTNPLLADWLASGECSNAVFLFGREFSQKLLENIQHIEDSECHAALARAIESCISIQEFGGPSTSSNSDLFRTPARIAEVAAWAADAEASGLTVLVNVSMANPAIS
ncbi:hypothetical protein KB206_00315 [Microvirga sp. STS02]|uniref:hypothetical protein n=1 Tax=Hymenobacter negativus TaxID=2795026 RepID=UPI0018DC5A6A|nr:MULTISPECIES: hypothetical protein [Bacteria]MBH8567308.1 hypothetical protein [Hymenobacter negativus]MBR7207040.1 hypothetical protein [Microvirga sp. STS02]